MAESAVLLVDDVLNGYLANDYVIQRDFDFGA
jgi:hypothetical protein